jgi:beta-lactamase class A
MGLATVKADFAPIFEKPSADSLRLDEALYGTSVQVIQQDDTGWCYLRTEHRSEGYVQAALLLADLDVAAAWRKYKKVIVLAPYIDVQKQPAADAPGVASLPRGGILVALGQPAADGWQKVGMVDGAVGYTRASYLGEAIGDWKAVSEDDMRWNIVETALSYNGAAWRTGGRTPLGIDAAGLAAMSYLMNGVTIPHRPDFEPGGPLKQVSVRDMEEGDLLFFPGSVGVYMGDGRFVHATAKAGGEGVVVNSLRPKDEDYCADLAGSIRMVAGLYGS